MADHIDTSSRELPGGHNTVECHAPNSGNPSQWLDLFGDSDTATYIEAGVQSAMSLLQRGLNKLNKSLILDVGVVFNHLVSVHQFTVG